MNFISLMNKYRCAKTEDYTHVSMYPYGGLYKIPDEELEQFYDEYRSCLIEGVKLGILERPKDIGPMVVDVDINLKAKRVMTLYLHDDIMKYARCFQKILKKYTGSNAVDCVVLEKPAYMNHGCCKNGFHLHFPTVWMSKAHRRLITKLVKESLDSKVLDDSAVRNNWLLYGSRKAADQDPYLFSFVVDSNGRELEREESRKRIFPNDILIKTLSIRNNPVGFITPILESIWIHHKPKPRKVQPKLVTNAGEENSDLITRCMKSIDPSRADDYHEWIKVGCILFKVDPSRVYQRWIEFSKHSYKYDEEHLSRVWDGFREYYNYTVGSLVYLARQDDPNFTLPGNERPKERLLCNKKEVSIYTRRQLVDMCRKRGLRNCTLLNKDELCEKLGIPSQSKNEKYEKSCRGMKARPREVILVEVTSGERITFKSIYAAAKAIGRNPGSIHLKKNTEKTLKSKVDKREYRIVVPV